MEEGNSVPVLFITFSRREGGPQAWFAQLAGHPEFSRKVNATVWKPEDIYRRAYGKLRLLSDCREQFAKAGRPSIVYVSLDLDFAAQVVLGLRLAGARAIIVHAHATRFGREGSARLRLYRWLVRTLSTRKAAVSERAALGMFGQGLDKVALLPAFIDFDALWKSSEKGAKPVLGFSLERVGGSLVFACVGRLAGSKNLSLAIEAFRQFRKSQPRVDTSLLLIGSGPEEERLRETCRQAGLEDHVHITGWVDNVAWFYRNIVDCLLMPSLHEGAPRAVLEAQAFGCSVIVSDAVPEFCLYRKDLGVRRHELDPEIWAAEMQKVTVGGKKELGDSMDIARQHPLFSIDQGIKRFLEILEPDRA